MVFVTLLGAVKAAKYAKHEFDKDKKRNTVIAPVEGSQDMMADRASSSNATSSGATEWWGTMRNPDAPPPTPEAPANHAGVGAWSRDHVMQQIADAQAERSSSIYDSSASASTDLSARVHRTSVDPSASTSPSETFKPSSQRSADIRLPESISHGNQQQEARSDDNDRASLVKVPSQDHKLNVSHEKRSSLELSGVDGPPNAVRQSSREEATAMKLNRQAKTVADGSFEAALQRKPSVKEERFPRKTAERTGETVSALARNASKGHWRRPSRTDERTSMVGRNESKGSNAIPQLEATATNQVVSALTRNASKGPRRRLERPVQVSQTAGSFEESGKGGGMENESSASVDGDAADLRSCASAFAGAATKKRVGRRPPNVAQSRGAATAQPATSGVAMSSNAGTATAATGAAVAGSSMYAEGSMKKRTSRR